MNIFEYFAIGTKSWDSLHFKFLLLWTYSNNILDAFSYLQDTREINKALDMSYY